MTENSESPKQSKLSGKLTLILFLILFPLFIVPALLTGKVYECQICVHTLQQREASYWMIGSFPLGEIDWQNIEKWPDDLQAEPALMSTFPDWPETNPTEFSREILEREPKHLWESTTREIALAFVFPVPNKQALLSTMKPVVAARALMIKSLEEDPEVYQRLHEKLIEDAPVEKVIRRGRIKSATDWDYQGQANASEILKPIQEAWSENDGLLSVSEMRSILIEFSEDSIE